MASRPKLDPEQRRARRAQRPQPAHSAAEVEPEIVEAVRPDAHRLLGIDRSASRLEVVRAFQRVVRSAPTPEAKASIQEAFSRTGVPAIRTVCPYGHALTIYDLAGEKHAVYCSRCYESGSDHVQHDYVSGATCTSVNVQAAEMDESKLPFEAAPSPLQHWTVAYAQKALAATAPPVQFTCAAAVMVTLAAGDRFSVLWRGDEPWLLLNHTCAVTYPLDPYIHHREAMAKARQEERVRREQWKSSLGM